MSLQIITDGKWKNIKYGYEVPKSVLDDCDWLSEEEKTDGWIQYRKTWYHVKEFSRVTSQSPFTPNWDGYLGDSFFSGVVIEFAANGEQYKIGTYIS